MGNEQAVDRVGARERGFRDKASSHSEQHSKRHSTTPVSVAHKGSPRESRRERHNDTQAATPPHESARRKPSPGRVEQRMRKRHSADTVAEGHRKSDTTQQPAEQSLFERLLVEPLAEKIFGYLSARDLFNCVSVSHGFLLQSSKDNLWERLALEDIRLQDLHERMLHERATLFPAVHVPPCLLFDSVKPFYWKSTYIKYAFLQSLHRTPVVRVVYDYLPRTSGELACNKGEIMELLRQDDNTCWCLVQRIGTSSPKGWVPSGYLEEMSPQERLSVMIASCRSPLSAQCCWLANTDIASTPPRNCASEQSRSPAIARALYSYVATNDKEISFKEYDLMSIIKKGGRMDGDLEDFEDLGLTKREKAKKAAEQERAERAEFPLEDQRFYWWKVSLTRRAKDGIGNVTVEGWIPGNMVTERVEYKIAMMDYEGANANELSLRKGQRVALLGANQVMKEQGWLFVQASGVRGWAPEHYLVDD